MEKKRLLIAAITLLASCTNNGENNKNENTDPNAIPEPPVINYSVLKVYPHDTASFTEGLLVHGGQLYESTGGQPRENNFKSYFGPVDIKTGKPIKRIMLDTSYFGEGINVINGKIYQLTCRDKKGIVYDAKIYKILEEFTFSQHGLRNQ